MENEYWKTIFFASRLYGGNYLGDNLPIQSWNWPKDTWFQTRLKKLQACKDKKETDND